MHNIDIADTNILIMQKKIYEKYASITNHLANTCISNIHTMYDCDTAITHISGTLIILIFHIQCHNHDITLH